MSKTISRTTRPTVENPSRCVGVRAPISIEEPKVITPTAVPLLSDYVTREQLAEELKITTRTLDKWAWLRSGPSKIKIGARCYYHRQDVLKWLDAQRDVQQAAA